MKAVADRDRFEAILDEVGSGAMDELELRCQEAEQMRFRSEGELELRAEINWQASARMDDKLSLSLSKMSLRTCALRNGRSNQSSWRWRMKSKRSPVSYVQKRRKPELRKRLDSVVNNNSTMQTLLLHHGILDTTVSLARSSKS